MVLIVLCSIFACSSENGDGSVPTTPTLPTGSINLGKFAVNGPVNAVEVAENGVAYIAGNFTTIGTYTGHGQIFNLADSLPTAMSTTAIQSGPILDATPDGNGGWYATGTFHTLGVGFAHMFADGSVDENWDPVSLLPVPSLKVGTAIHFDGELVYVATSGNIFAFDKSTGEVRWQSDSLTGPINEIVSYGTKLFVAGAFHVTVDTAGGKVRMNNLIALDTANGEVDLNWGGADSEIQALAVNSNNGTVYVAGKFRKLGVREGVSGINRGRIAAMDINGNVTDWNPNADGSLTNSTPISALTYGDTIIYVGGSHLSAVNESGDVLPWKPQLAQPIHSLQIGTHRGNVYVVGLFNDLEKKIYSAAYDDIGNEISWNVNVNDVILTLSVSNDQILLSGEFTSNNSIAKNGLAAITMNGYLVDWEAEIDGFGINEMALAGSTLYLAGGWMVVSAEEARLGLAAIDLNGQLLDWNPGDIGLVTTMAVDSTHIYVGGNLNRVDRNIAAFNRKNGAMKANFPDVDARVRAIHATDGTLYIGGEFKNINGTPSPNIAAIQTTENKILAWSTRFNMSVPENINMPSSPVIHDINDNGNSLFVSGNFVDVNGVSRLGAAAFSFDGTLLDWQIDNSRSSVPYKISIFDSTVFLGYSEPQFPLGAYDASNGSVIPMLELNSLVSASALIQDIGQFGSDLIIVGQFKELGKVGYSNIAILPQP